jgi:hypothetical protein
MNSNGPVIIIEDDADDQYVFQEVSKNWITKIKFYFLQVTTRLFIT